jgi:uncharacterized protein
MGFGVVVILSWVGVEIAIVSAWAAIGIVAGREGLPKNLSSSGLLLALVTCLGAPVSFGLTWLFAKLRHGMPVREYLAFRPVSLKALGIWTLVLLVFLVLSDCLSVWLGRPIVPEFMRDAYQSAGFKPLLWLALVVGAPLMEETLFRGFMFQGLLHSKLGTWWTIVLTSFCWSILHLQYDAYGIGTILVLGCLLGWVRLKTGSVYATMFLHALTNLGATLEVTLLPN